MSELYRGIWHVYVVDPRKGGKILLDGMSVIAGTEAEAQIKANIAQVIQDAGLDFGQVDIYCELVAHFIRPRKDVHKVILAKDEESD
jgi:hypothetical protein